ncbi:glycerophosphodiester phosphodiesterase domain-containing protein 5 isoform X2 [Hypomesus transpacificus]|uniref:glycerophosphodiester phosphodiesterase domain-containing protein 5 isoform X2 n=1 Tax=Hypomesus transpacificus TaxID=137520 RepID=UPI001F07D9E9|nr:glycerophosphodiester phosphodiesterase domain-containing protein 5 isoform X2 [Hypomesus transpacificus]
MVKHQPLAPTQVYEKQLCLSFVTGIYGCRWKRYQRSHDDSSKWERAWFFLLCISFFLLLFWSYFWLEAHNDYNEFNWLLYNRSGEWRDGTVPILASTAVGFSYITFLMILALFHISLGQQLNLYWIHKIGVLAALLTTISGVVSIDDIWGSEWDIVLISLQSTGPFLHIGALAAMTALSWLVAGHVIRTERSRLQTAVLLVYLGVLLALYMAPLTFSFPCVMDRSGLKPRPDVIGRRGAPMLAPENTLMSFNKALQQGVSSLEADVTVSLDGVPFLMRDDTLRRTTDVGKVFPLRQLDDASFFNWTEIRSLNAGKWFLKSDPYWTARSLTERDRNRIGNQTVCSLVEMLRLAARANRSTLLNLRRPPPEHPHYKTWIMDTLWAVQRSGISQKREVPGQQHERDGVPGERAVALLGAVVQRRVLRLHGRAPGPPEGALPRLDHESGCVLLDLDDVRSGVHRCSHRRVYFSKVEDERHAELQPGADHAERRGAPAQSRRQRHEGKAHFLRNQQWGREHGGVVSVPTERLRQLLSWRCHPLNTRILSHSCKRLELSLEGEGVFSFETTVFLRFYSSPMFCHSLMA